MEMVLIPGPRRPAPGQEPAETGVEGASFRIARLPKVLWLHDLLLTDE